MMLKHICCLLMLLTGVSSLYAVDAATFSYGRGTPADLQAFTIGGQWDWQRQWEFSPGWQLAGYWNADVGYWTTHGDDQGNNRKLITVAAGPNVRLEYDMQNGLDLGYYIEMGWGPALYSSTQLATNALGSFWGIQQKIGAGIRFGNRLQYDLSYHYVDNTNYGIYANNAGFSVGWLLTFTYHLTTQG